MASRKKTAIDSQGCVVKVDDDKHKERVLYCLPRYVDTFGFNLEIKQFAIVLLLARVMLGSNGVLAFLFALALYTAFQRFTSTSGHTYGSGSSLGSRVTNVRGMGDLPKDLKVPSG
uniref:SAYSvFN domain-containing protein n=2 Tax=Ditylum brightwellii TaxID=49249 RepID=A0A6U3NPP7_9STRA|mmetsp:Transcript_1050/g.1715  ORF Transcript_1050/g.1715 Transcript_1050/m.1715 type:complete len:116 (+) Transcript_1050:194-541(+)